MEFTKATTEEAFPTAITKEAVDEITSSVQSIIPIEQSLENYIDFLRKIFRPSSPDYNDKVGNLWKGVVFPTVGDHGRTYGGDTPEEYAPKVKENLTRMLQEDDNKNIANNIITAVIQFPTTAEQSRKLIPRLDTAESEAKSHADEAWFTSTKQRRYSRKQVLRDLTNTLKSIVGLYDNGTTQYLMKNAFQPFIKREQLVALRGIEFNNSRGTNWLPKDPLMVIGKFLGGTGKSKCKKILTKKKYTSRKSPAYSASKCAKGTKKTGNDGKMYVVKAAKNGVKRWVKLTQKKKSKSKKKNKH